MDLDHLLRDLPKYKQWLSTESWDQWEEFIANKSKLSELVDLLWKLPRLIESAEESEEARKRQPTPWVDTKTAEMFHKESADIQEVFILVVLV